MDPQTNLLLADDDFDDAFFFKEAIRDISQEFSIKVLQDGEQLMTYLHEQASNLPKLIFLDLNMPRKNGYECLKEIKKDLRLRDLAVIVYSTSDQDEVVKLLYEAGAQFYIQKPDNFAKLKSVLKKALDFAKEMKYHQPHQSKFVIS